MRDKNLNLNKFNIQLEKNVKSRCKLCDDKFLTRPVFVSPTLPVDPEDVIILYPKSYRLLRVLAISQWYFTEMLHWRIFLDLKDMSLSHLNKKQRLELAILLSSKENMEKYLYRTERYSGSEIFGNILGNDLQDLLKELKFLRKTKKHPRKTIRRRGYKDKGSRRPSHRWLPRFDYSFTEYQNHRDKDKYLLNKLTKRILLILENN